MVDYKFNYSFIIPHKNLPELLRRCISSIPKRDDVQIIIIDDNSDPSTVDFGNFPFLDKKNVEVIFDKSGKRQGHARNLGIDRAEGKWLIFIDSDDFFFHNIDKVLDENIDNEADIVFFKATLLDNDTYLPYANQNCLPNESINKYLNGDIDGEHFVRFRHPVPWGKLIKSSLVRKHKIRFAEIERLEDAQFSYQCGYYANKIDVKNFSIYCYIQRPNTVTSQITDESSFTLVKVCVDCMRFLCDKRLSKTPTFQIMTNLAFDNILRMKNKSDYYERSLDYLLKSDFSQDFINNKMRSTRISQFKSKIFSKINKHLR